MYGGGLNILYIDENAIDYCEGGKGGKRRKEKNTGIITHASNMEPEARRSSRSRGSL